MFEVVPGELWTDAAPLSTLGLSIGRRVTVARNANGGLVVFSPAPGTAQAIANVRALGDVAAFVVANRVHDLFYEDYFRPFEGTVFLAPAGVIENHAT